MRILSRHEPRMVRLMWSKRRPGTVGLQTVLIFALSMMILSSVYWLWSAADIGGDGQEGIQGQTVAILDRLLQPDFVNGSPSGQGTSGSDTGGGTTGGGSTTQGSGSGASSDGGDNKANGGALDNGGKNRPVDPEMDEGEVDPVGDGLTTAVAKGIMENSGERVISVTKAALQTAQVGLETATGQFEQARELFRAALVDPTLSGAQVEALRQNLLAQEKLYQQAADKVADLGTQVSARKSLLKWADGAIDAGLGAKELWDADLKVKELARQGKLDEAWQHSCGSAMGFVAQTITAGVKVLRLTGIAGELAEEAVQEAATAAGNELGKLSFGTMNDLSHWLYGQSWWPKNRKPRDIGGLVPRKPESAMVAADGRLRLVRQQLRDGIADVL